MKSREISRGNSGISCKIQIAAQLEKSLLMSNLESHVPYLEVGDKVFQSRSLFYRHGTKTTEYVS